jgi:lysozyme
MKVSQKGLDLIAKFEGIRLVAYKCSAGVWTVGIGSTRYEDGSPVKAGDVLESEAAAYKLFANTLTQYEQGVDKAITAEISQHQFDALVSLAYNIGVSAFAKSTVARRVNANPDDPKIRDGFLLWVKAAGKVLAGLVRRRTAEADLYFS